ncbi:extracellular solute-binding protein [Leucobacter rhizosphaerae]|uniref:Extracellular solute-binding protein n=1 Tax=Leucobacter rhizosphaerae TaxID=2932245 RepID=A0ABY4FYW6_9MICO|nr:MULTISPECIES: extracellular solute-binding protein [Leucobacter]UOQ61496.1 extracellular solute-binding protein [Leucobacter rhizosphaerae]UOR02400.1 extracellular solute-binding protein [Leucobacter allii]
MSNGGALQDAQDTAYLVPFMEEFPGIAVVQDTGSTDYAKFTAQIESGNVDWDLADIGSDFGGQDPARYFEPFDCDVVECPEGENPVYRIPTHAYASILGYNEGALSEAPSSWADFFDTEKFPGKRAMFQLAGATGIFEAALLADGVAPEDLYPIDYERALAKYDTIKDDIIWATSPTDTARLVADGEAVMGNLFSSQAFAMAQNDTPIEVIWDGMGLGFDYLVIPKGAKNVDNANLLAGFITSAENNGRLSEIYPVAPGNPAAAVDESAETYPFLPLPDRAELSYTFDGNWYSENQQQIVDAFQAWLQQ